MLTFNFSPFPTLHTDRLTLRKINVEDADEIFMLQSDERVNKFIDRPIAHSLDDSKNFISRIRSRGSNNELLYWAITQTKTSRLIGTVVFWNIDKEKEVAEVAFELLPDFQGQGLMREALNEVIAYGFNGLGLQSIVALPEEANERSIILLEKAGFAKEAGYDHGGTDSAVVKYVLPAKAAVEV